MRRVFVLSAACAAALVTAAATPAAAQEPRVGQAQVYRSLQPSDLATLLNRQDYTSVKKSGDKRFDIETQGGFKFSVELTVCDVEGAPVGCLGVNLFASWTVDAADRPKLQGAVDKFNDQYRIGKALLATDSIFAERYVITDGGVTLEHIVDELGEFESSMGEFTRLMQEAMGD